MGPVSTSGCGNAAYHWTFSDGGSVDGVHPTHTFADNGPSNGPYSGTLTVTEGARTDSTPFSVTVDNAAPVGRRGWDVRARPGSVVTFVGTATDPSSVDQASLAYTWNFGDGTPTASAAAGTATHVYPNPGTYDATLTVCDKDGGCNVGVRRVTVASQQRQPSLLVYFGDFIGRTGSNSDMRAILVDRNAYPLAGRTVTFTLGGQTVSATTDSRGVAAHDAEGDGRARAVRGERHVASGGHGRPAVCGFVDDAPVPGAPAVRGRVGGRPGDGPPADIATLTLPACEDRGDDRLRRVAVVRLRPRPTRASAGCSVSCSSACRSISRSSSGRHCW